MERQLLSTGPHLVRSRENWVSVWEDKGHVVTADDGVISATRAITLNGRLHWLVRRPGKRLAYHAAPLDPFEAIEEAETAWSSRRDTRRNWAEAKAVRNALLSGRLKYSIEVHEVQGTGLCEIGTREFLRQFAMGNLERFSGRSVALMSLIEPQALHVLWAVHKRRTAEERHGASASTRQRTVQNIS